MAQYKLDFFRCKALELAATKVLATNFATDTDSSSLSIAILVIAHIHLTMISKLAMFLQEWSRSYHQLTLSFITARTIRVGWPNLLYPFIHSFIGGIAAGNGFNL